MDAIETPRASTDAEGSHFDVIVVGAGFGGLCALHKLREMGFSVRVIEAGSGVGGTWFWNRYPGARCDNESLEYSYSFSNELQREWRWTERYAAQPEILSYLEHVASRFDLYRSIQLQTRVTSAIYQRESRMWRVETNRGQVITARFCILATGNLSVSKLPDWPGLDTFEGEVFRTATWPPGGVNFEGKRVGVVGTGSSGIQVIPQIAKQAKELVVFQRTPNFAVPANNWSHPKEVAPIGEREYAAAREHARRSPLGFFSPLPTQSALEVDSDERGARFESLWQRGGTIFLLSYNDLLFNQISNDTAAEFVRRKIRCVVTNPQIAEKLTPRGYPIGAKRLCLEINYYNTFNRDNVELVDLLNEPVVSVGKNGVTTNRNTYALDSLVFATGFDAMTGAIKAIDIRGKNGQGLRDEWSNGPRAYLGLMSAGYPNLFLLTGPGSPSVLSNVVVSIEQHVEWISNCLGYLRERSANTIEATSAAEDSWLDHVHHIAQQTLFPKAKSWYYGLTRDGRRVFMPYIGGVGAYREKCDQVARAGYEGFSIS